MLVWLGAFAVIFVGSHLLLSHPLRAPLVSRFGEPAFLAGYSCFALVTLTLLIGAYRETPTGMPLWPVGDALWMAVTVIMLTASILLVGSFIGNPALPKAGATTAPRTAKGAFVVTRHPMNWSFALWAACHIAVLPTGPNLILCGAIIFLALVGSGLQDRKKEVLQPDRWRDWESKTSFWPFAAIISGRARLAGFGWIVPTAGVVLWLAATWAHRPAAGVSAGVWRWIG